MNAPRPFALQRWLVLLLAGLLALGPFLHSHFGSSHDTGFHLDGVHALHAAHDPSNAVQAGDEESPALGVAASLPHAGDEGLPDIGWALLLTVLALLPARQQPLPCGRRTHVRKHALYHAGLPPPSLAPPAP